MNKSKNVSVSTFSSETESDSSETTATDSESDSDTNTETVKYRTYASKKLCSKVSEVSSERNPKSLKKKWKTAFEIFSGQEWNRINTSRKESLQREELIQLSKVNLSFLLKGFYNYYPLKIVYELPIEVRFWTKCNNDWFWMDDFNFLGNRSKMEKLIDRGTYRIHFAIQYAIR